MIQKVTFGYITPQFINMKTSSNGRDATENVDRSSVPHILEITLELETEQREKLYRIFRENKPIWLLKKEKENTSIANS